MNVDVAVSPPRGRARKWYVAARRSAVVLVTASAVGAGLLQGTAHALPRHSEPWKTVESIAPVAGKGCRVAHHYRIDASSAAEARNISNSIQNISKNGASNGVRMGVTTSFVRGQTQFTIVAFTDVRGVATQDCIAQKVAPHRGRDLRQVPTWAKGVLAGLAATAIYISVTAFATAAAAVVTGGTGALVAGIIGGCVGGAASAYVANRIMGVTNKGALIGNTLYNCFAGAVGAVFLGPGIRAMETWIVESATLNALRARAVNWMGTGLYASLLDARAAITAARQRLHV